MDYRAPLITALLLTILFMVSCQDDYAPVSYQSYLSTHQYAVGQSNMTTVDTLRNRPIKTEIWYPTQDTTGANVAAEYPFKLPPTSHDAPIIAGSLPLILLSHGTGGNRISQMWLACELASSGYIVAAVDHYGNTVDHKIPENFVTVWDRPMDMSYALDELLNTSRFHASIDTTKIGMAGFSLGGYTTIALAGGQLNYDLLKEFSHTDEGQIEFTLPELGDVSALITPQIIEQGNTQYKNLKDHRMAAFVAMAPAIGQGFNDRSQIAQINNKILIIGAQEDQRTPVATNAKHYHSLVEGSIYHELTGQVGHYIFMNEAKNGLKRHAPIVFKDHESIDRQAIHQEVAQMIRKFFDKELQVER